MKNSNLKSGLVNESNPKTSTSILKDPFISNQFSVDSNIDVLNKNNVYNLLGDKFINEYLKTINKNQKETLKIQKDNLDKFKKDYQDSIDLKTTELEKKIESSKLSVIETLGIFVALFTFISIDIQIIKSTYNLLSLVGFILITLGSLLFFIVTLHSIVTSSDKKNWVKIFASFVFTIILLGVGIILIDKNNKANYYIFDKNQFDNDYVKTVNKNRTDFDNFKKCLQDNHWKNPECF